MGWLYGWMPYYGECGCAFNDRIVNVIEGAPTPTSFNIDCDVFSLAIWGIRLKCNLFDFCDGAL